MKGIARKAAFAAILVAIVLLASQTISLSKGGFDDPQILDRFQFYIGSAIGFFFGIFLIFISELFIRKGDKTYGDSVLFASPGENPSFRFFKRFTLIQLTFIFFIIFSILGLIAFSMGEQSFTGVLFLEEQQFTAFDSIIFSATLIPISENLGAAFVGALTIFLLRIFARKNNISKPQFILFCFLLTTIFIGLFGLSWHMWRYGGSELTLLRVFGFWALGGFITVLSGSFIPFVIMHFTNNFFIDIRRFFSAEIVLLYTISLIILLCIIYVVIYNKRLLGESKPEQFEGSM